MHLAPALLMAALILSPCAAAAQPAAGATLGAVPPGGTITSSGSSVTIGAGGMAGAAVAGKGPLVTARRVLPEFRKISVDGPLELTVSRAASSEVQLQAQENLLPMLRTSVEGDTLRIFTTGAFTTTMPIRASVMTSSLEAITVSGSGQVVVLDAVGSHLAAQVLGSGSLGLAGRMDSLSVQLHGAGALDASQLQAKTVSIQILGSGNASVLATEAAEIASAGAGNVSVAGQPKHRHVDVRGSGKVVFR